MTSTRLALAVLLTMFLPLTLSAQGKSELKKVAQEAFDDQNWAEASKSLAKLVEIDAKDAVAWFQLGYSLHSQRKYDAALKAHKKAATFKNARTVQPAIYNVACVYAIQKDKDQAFEWLNKAVDAGFVNVDQIDTDPDMDNLRDDPRLKKIVGRMANASYDAPVRVFNYSAKRHSTRATYFAGKNAPGHLAIDYGSPKWKDSFNDNIASEKFINRRWRFGDNFWTSLDTNIPITMSGTEIAAGHYYLTVTHKGDKKFVLNVLDPVAVRKYRIDPFYAHRTKGGTDVTLVHEEVDEVAERLTINIKVDKQNNAKGMLIIRFGPHKLTAPMKIHLVR